MVIFIFAMIHRNQNCLVWMVVLAALLACPASAHWPTTIRENLELTPLDTMGIETGTMPYPDNSTLLVFKKYWLGIRYQIIDKFGNFKYPLDQPLTPANQSVATWWFQLISDGHGGAIVCWTAHEINPMQAIVAQHLDSLGNRLWGDSGLVIFPVPEQDFRVCSDSLGGLILAVSPDESSLDWTDLYAQRVDADGNLLWGPMGVLVCGIPLSEARYPRVAPDGDGGCFIVWEDSRPPQLPYTSLFGQHLDDEGNRLWAQDLYIVNDISDHETIPDGQGGFILQSNPNLDYNTHWRINGAGQVLWVRDHLSWNGGAGAAIMPGEPGFFYLSFNYGNNIYAQRIDINGNTYWPSGAAIGALMLSIPGWVPLGELGGYYFYPYFYGLIGMTDNTRCNVRLTVQKMDSSGQRMLGDYGTSIAAINVSYAYYGSFSFPNLASDSEDGMVATFQIDSVGNYQDVFVKRANSDGTLGGPFPPNIALSPHNPPIVIPSTGGSFTYDVALADMDSIGGLFDAWIEVTLPDGEKLNMAAHQEIPIQPEQIILKPNVQQIVPGSAPPGLYTYAVHAGNYHYNSPWGQSSFTFIKQGGPYNPGRFPEWNLSGFWEGKEASISPPVSKPAFWLAVSPNPFNAQTAIGYQISANSRVSLKIYDTAGRLVETLVDGWQVAGEHEATFDGTRLSSGIYLVRMEAGENRLVHKVVILK